MFLNVLAMKKDVLVCEIVLALITFAVFDTSSCSSFSFGIISLCDRPENV